MTEPRECNVCGATDNLSMMDTMLWCPSCKEKEVKMQAEVTKTADDRINRMNQEHIEKVSLEQSRQIDNLIQLKTDLFNASTVSILDLKNTIDADESIENKELKLAEELTNRFKHLKDVIFNLDEQKVKLTNEQRAIQVYLNDLARKLKQEERDRLRLQDISYKPKAPVIKKPSKKKPRLDKVALAKYSQELGIEQFALQAYTLQKGITVEEAANQMKEMIANMKKG